MKKMFRGCTATVICLTALIYIIVEVADKNAEQIVNIMIMVSVILTSCLLGMNFQEFEKFSFKKRKNKEEEAPKKEFSNEDKHIIAVHESGHAIVNAALLTCNMVTEISILRRGTSLGRVEYDDGEKPIWLKDELLAVIARIYGGRAAEEIILQITSSTCMEDMKDATVLAKEYVNQFAMKGKLVAEIDDQDFNNVLEKANLDTIEEVCREAYTLAENTIRQNKEAVCKLAEILEKQEVIHQEEFEQFVKDNNVNEKN